MLNEDEEAAAAGEWQAHTVDKSSGRYDTRSWLCCWWLAPNTTTYHRAIHTTPGTSGWTSSCLCDNVCCDLAVTSFRMIRRHTMELSALIMTVSINGHVKGALRELSCNIKLTGNRM